VGILYQLREWKMSYITDLSNQYREEIRDMARQVMSEINDRYDVYMQDIQDERMRIAHELEVFYEQQHIQDAIAPYTDFESWFNSLSEDEQSDWHELYVAYQYGPNGDSLVRDDDTFTHNVLVMLFSKDDYQKLPFCCHCDSRGHQSGACIKDLQS
jgi:hypothetical protein